jgi:hypothetical protein
MPELAAEFNPKDDRLAGKRVVRRSAAESQKPSNENDEEEKLRPHGDLLKNAVAARESARIGLNRSTLALGRSLAAGQRFAGLVEINDAGVFFLFAHDILRVTGRRNSA